MIPLSLTQFEQQLASEALEAYIGVKVAYPAQVPNETAGYALMAALDVLSLEYDDAGRDKGSLLNLLECVTKWLESITAEVRK